MQKVMGISNITQKGQVTIPAPLRQKLALKKSDQVIFILKKNDVLITPLVKDITDFFGYHKKTGKETVPPEQVEQEVKKVVAEKIAKEGQ